MLNQREKFFIGVTIVILLMAPVLFSRIGSSVTAVSPDAIAIRVISNPNHYSALRWYKTQKFTGSPQAIVVDGYEGIRDGRTVYVNAANVSGTNLYTNIYLISYNQSAENATVDIFGQMLQHWKFNDNVPSIGTCANASSTGCTLTSDCPKGDYCKSVKAKVVRDTRRMADMKDIATAVENYKNRSGFYPKLPTGTYLTNKSVSTWPSWKERLGADLGIAIPVDPVNQLGDCGGPNFNPVTCWDENTQKFAGAVGAASITLPVGSMAYAYAANPNGSSYLLYIGTESGVLTASGAFNYTGGTTGGTTGMGGGGGGGGTVLPPVVNCGTMLGNANQVFTGYVNASDPGGLSMSWSIDTSGSSWTGWSAAPVLQTTALPNQRRVYAASAGSLGSYSVQVTVTNSGGGVANVTCPIVISASCGNGVLEGGEQCDGAGGACTSIAGGGFSGGSYTCNPTCTYNTSACISPSVCGNGTVETGEQCDTTGGLCTAITGASYIGGGYTCNSNCTYNTSACISAPVCGNSITESGETCDNGASNTNTPCASAYGGSCNYCDTSCQSHTVQGPACGDSITNGPETCDNGAANTNTPCVAAYGANCNYCNTACQSQTVVGPRCGDSIVQTANGEQCDTTGGTCASITGGGFISGSFTCTPTCTRNTSACVASPVCGNGTIESGETCDNGALNTNTPCTAAYGANCNYCNTSCQSQTVVGPRCGDSIVQTANGEQCDTTGGLCTSITGGGYTSGSYTCSATCTYNTSGCTSGCIFGTSTFGGCLIQ